MTAGATVTFDGTAYSDVLTVTWREIRGTLERARRELDPWLRDLARIREVFEKALREARRWPEVARTWGALPTWRPLPAPDRSSARAMPLRLHARQAVPARTRRRLRTWER